MALEIEYKYNDGEVNPSACVRIGNVVLSTLGVVASVEFYRSIESRARCKTVETSFVRALERVQAWNAMSEEARQADPNARPNEPTRPDTQQYILSVQQVGLKPEALEPVPDLIAGGKSVTEATLTACYDALKADMFPDAKDV